MHMFICRLILIFQHVPPVSSPTSSSVLTSSSSGFHRKDGSSDLSSIFGRGRYKFWGLAAIFLVAFWSMLTGTVTLLWSAGDLQNRFDDDYCSRASEDLDALDMEEREKLVRHMWDVHSNNQRLKFGGFWQEAFVAAYEDLTSDVPEVREAAISEIARMSTLYLPLNPPLVPSWLTLSVNVPHIKEVDNEMLTYIMDTIYKSMNLQGFLSLWSLNANQVDNGAMSLKGKRS